MVLLVTAAASWFGVGSVWLAQLSWQLFAYVGPAQFAAYHWVWWRGIWWAIFPVAGVGFAGVLAQLRWRPPRVAPGVLWGALVVQVVAYAGTVFWWGPGQARMVDVHLADGSVNPLFYQLVDTNWVRVALFTVAGLLEFWILARAFRPGPGGPESRV